MSIRLMSAAWDLDIPSTEKMVLLCLCDFANDEGVCWPSRERLALKCSVTDRTVRRAIKSLENLGFIRRQKRLHDTWICHISLGGQDVPSEGTDCPARGDTVSPKPSGTTIKQNNKRAIPANWWPEEFGTNTKSRRIVDSWTQDDLATQVETFTAHHTKVGSKFDCWQSAWSTWVLNSEKFKPRQIATRGTSLADIGDDVRRMFNG